MRRVQLQLDGSLRAGRYAIPGDYGVAMRVIVPSGVTTSITVDLERFDGQLRVRKARLALSKRVRVLNPRRAFHRERTGARRFIDFVKDLFADLLADGAYVDPKNGEFEVAGVVELLRLFKRKIPPELNPRLNLTPEELILGSDAPPITAPPESIPSPTPEATHEALRALARAVVPGTFRVELETDPVDLPRGLPLQLQPAPTAMPLRGRLEGRAEFTDDGTLSFETTGTGPALETALGSVKLTGSLAIGADRRGQLVLDVSGRALVEPAMTGFVLTRPPQLHLPFKPRPWTSPFNATLVATARDGKWQVAIESEVDVAADLQTGARVAIDGSELGPRGVELAAKGMLRFAASAGGPARIEVPQLTMTGKLAGADMDLAIIGQTPLDVGASAELMVSRLAVELANRAVTGGLALRYAMAPTGVVAELLPQLDHIDGELALELQPGGKGRLDRAFGLFEDMVASLLEVVRPHRAEPAVAAAPAADLSATGLGVRLAAVAAAVAHPGNHARLLDDGAAALDARLQLIRDAKRTLVLQTSELEDDDAGRAVVAALVSVARGGVTVRVIVDGLADLDDVDGLRVEPEVYRTLREGGVALQVFNDPRKSGLSALLEQISVLPELAGDSFQDLQRLADPYTALQVFLRLCAFATSADGTEASRKTVADGLARLLQASAAFQPPVSADQAAVPTGVLSKLLYAARHVIALNHRFGERVLVADEEVAIVGGRDVRVAHLGASADGHDADVWLAGPAAAALHEVFAASWNHLTGEWLAPCGGGVRHDDGVVAQIIVHRPGTPSAHAISRAMVEAIRATRAGERISITCPRFLPTAALASLQDALCAAAGRGVAVHVLTNSEDTAELPATLSAAVFVWRELLAVGAHIYLARRRPIRACIARFGGQTSIITSWTWDNRSETLASAVAAVLYDEVTAARLAAAFDAEIGNGAVELRLDDIAAQRLGTELRSGVLAAIGSWF